MWYFYVLQSIKEPNYFYKGSTGKLKERFHQHNNGEVESTRPRRPYRLVYYEAYLTEKTARDREAGVKQSGSISVPLLRRIKNSLEDK